MNTASRMLISWLACCVAVGLVHCGGGRPGEVGNIGGTIDGLTVPGLVLRLEHNGTHDDLPISPFAERFTFDARLVEGTEYSVVVAAQPGPQVCTVFNGDGTMGASGTGDIVVTCGAEAHTVGGKLSGLTGTVELKLNGETYAVSANGGFTFPNKLPVSSGYLVAVKTQPAGGTCSLTGSSGVIGHADVTDVEVTCRRFLFVAVGDKVATSPDGAAWTAGTIPAGWYYGVAWNGSVYCAVGTNVATTSPDGITWTPRSIPTGTYRAVAWNGARFVAVGSGVIATSQDCATWTTTTNPGGGYEAVAWGGIWVAAGYGTVATSQDGITWTNQDGVSQAANAIAWNGTVFVIPSWSGSKGGPLPFAYRSTDGANWAQDGSSGGIFTAIAAHGSLIVAAGQFASPYHGALCQTTTDGKTWTTREIPTGNYAAMTWGNGQFLAIGGGISGEPVATSSQDGASWTQTTSMPAGNYQAVVFGGPSP